MKRKIVVIPDSFKGSMTSTQVADIIGDVIEKETSYETVRIPIADGGEGSTDCILRSLGGEKTKMLVEGPEHKAIESCYGMTKDGTAIIEIAESSGITKQSSYDALGATTYGFGELILDALDEGVRKFLLCLGGSATTDAATGMAAALGVKFFDEKGKEFVPTGGSLSKVARIDLQGLDSRIGESEFTVMSDVENPLYGELGAAYVYGPQKGASPEDVIKLDEGLRHISEVMEAVGLISCQNVKGAGAAGGAGYGCVAFLDAKIVSGINAMLDICKFDEVVKDAEVIITGEGKFDEQSLMGKVVDGIHSRASGKPMVVFCGISTIDKAKSNEMDIEVIEIGRGIPLEESIKHGDEYLKNKAHEWIKASRIIQEEE